MEPVRRGRAAASQTSCGQGRADRLRHAALISSPYLEVSHSSSSSGARVLPGTRRCSSDVIGEFQIDR